MSCGICGGQSGTGISLFLVFLFPLPSILPTAPHSSPSIIIRGWYKKSVVASVIVDSDPIQSPPLTKNRKIGFRIACGSADLQTEYLPDTKPEGYM
jgi:hypothetical protein